MRKTDSETVNLRILPQLSEEYTIDYTVDAATVSEEDKALLYRSGYKILHRANITMQGSTRLKYTLNPHLKKFCDAAGKDQNVISFQEFRELF